VFSLVQRYTPDIEKGVRQYQVPRSGSCSATGPVLDMSRFRPLSSTDARCSVTSLTRWWGWEACA
jgi:hypothetical protein